MCDIDTPALRAELARLGKPQWKLAHAVGLPASTLSDFLRGVRPGPADLRERIEQAIGLAPGTLRKSSEVPSPPP